MPRNYIGLATTPHDPALAVVNARGEVVFAEATERYLQNKRAWCYPPEDVVRARRLIEEHCDPDADLVIATSWSRRSIYLTRALFHNPLGRRVVDRLVPGTDEEQSFYYRFGRMLSAHFDAGAGEVVAFNASQVRPRARVTRRAYDHHLTHAAAGCYASPFDRAVCVVMDAFGELTSNAFFRYEDGRLSRLDYRVDPRASLGVYYSYLCHLCGFSPIEGEEWKVMGLAAYGRRDEEIAAHLRTLLRVEDGRLVPGDARRAQQRLEAWRVRPGDDPRKGADLAHTGQAYFCEMVAEVLRGVGRLGVSPNLVLGGGCALNSSCNGALLAATPFERLYVFAAPADDGNAVGAALLAYHEDAPPARAPARHQTPYLGERLSPRSLAHLRTYSGLRRLDGAGKSPPRLAAELLAQGKIVGWAQGRAEFGPRALGNRSILADPRSAAVKERLNATVKFREEFRPFAPSILHEHGADYFDDYQESPYMERTLRFRPEVRARVPGVVHVDGTGRLQTVKRAWNERFHDLIAAFHELTGVPLVLNTSFNVMGKPIIHGVEDAVAVFLTSGLDALVLEDDVYVK